MKNLRKLLLVAALLALVLGALAGCGGNADPTEPTVSVQDLPEADPYVYHNPQVQKAQPDEGFTIDGVLDEQAYQDSNWMWLHNDDGGNNVTIGITSHWGEEGMYFVYDVTESVPIYVNLERASYLNSCIEMYLAPQNVTSRKENSYFEIDLLPTGNLAFKISNGRDGYNDATTTYDKSPVLGATTKGGQVNTPECYGYNLELFIPWEYMRWLGLDVEAMQNGFVYVNPAHITANNLNGTDTNLDRYWYHYAQQQGAGFSQIFQYFRFNADGAMGVVDVNTQAQGCAVEADPTAVSGVNTIITATPEAGKTITSLVVNGQEMIGLASYTPQGAAQVVIRAGEEPLTITAEAAQVAPGPYSLSGQVSLKRYTGTDPLEGTQLTYTGPLGEKPIELAEDGTFKLEGLDEGSYLITCKRDGYIKHTRNLIINRDMVIEVPMEYDQFYIERGTSWILDQQNQGILGRFSGDQAYVMTNDWYGDFTFTGYLYFDEELLEQGSTDAFQQQRNGLRIKFEGGRTLHLDLLRQNDRYMLQFAKIHNTALTNWSTAGYLDDEQLADLFEDNRIEVTLMRQNDLVAVWAGGKGVAMVDLDDSIWQEKAQLGFETWGANRGMYEMEYEILEGSQENLYRAYKPGANWNSAPMYEGYIISKGTLDKNGNGDTGWLYSKLQSYAGATVWLRDLTPEDHEFRFAQRFEFENGKRYTITVLHDLKNQRYVLQYLNEGVVKNWSIPYVFTQEQVAKIQADQVGLAFKVINIDNYMNVYLDNEQVLSVDITNDTDGNPTGIFNTPAIACHRMYGYGNFQIDIPYTFHLQPTRSQISLVGSGAVLAGKNHLIGDTIVIKPADAGMDILGATLDGTPIEADADGCLRFIATAEAHEVVVDAQRTRLWKDNANMDTSRQEEGIISYTGNPASATGDTGYFDTYERLYGDVSMFIQDTNPAAVDFRASVKFEYEGGKNFWISILAEKDRYIVQSLNGGFIPAWKNYHTLTAEEVAAVQAGATLRVFVTGSNAVVRLDGKELCVVDLSAGDVAGQPAQIRIRMYGNKGVTLPLNPVLGPIPETYTFTDTGSLAGSVSADKTYYLPGETMELTVKLNSGFVDPVLVIDGKEAPVTEGKFAIADLNASHTGCVTATQTEDWTTTSTYWDLSAQKQGILAVPTPNTSGGTGSGWVSTYRNDYRELGITYGYAAPVSKESYGLAFKLEFANGKNISFRVINDKENGAGYRLQAMSGNSMINNWSQIYLFNAQQNAKIASGEAMHFRFAAVGNQLIFFIDNVRVAALDLSAHGIAGVGFKANIWQYQHVGSPVELRYTLGGEPETGKLTLVQPEDGTLTASGTEYVVGEILSVTAKATTVNPLRWVKLDGQAVTVDANGTFAFQTTGTAHEVTANFVPDPVWITTNAEWDVSQQKFGQLSILGTDGDSGWLDTVKNSYKELTLHYTNVKENTFENAIAIELQFTGGKIARFRLISDNKNDLTIFRLQNMGAASNMIATGWPNIYTLSTAQNQKLTQQGIDITVSALGNDLVFFVDGVRVARYDLSAQGIADQTFKVRLRSYNTTGVVTPMTFALSESVQVGKPELSAVGGTVTADPGSYRVGETVKLELKANDGYEFQSLTIDGKEVEVSGSSYTLATTAASHKVEALFQLTNKIWSETNAEWNTAQQNIGILQVNGPDGDTGWISTNTATYRDMSITFSAAGAGKEKEGLQLSFKLEFTNGKMITYRLINDQNNGAGYRLQAMSNGANMIGNWSGIYSLTEAQKTKLLSPQGITLRVVADGNNVSFMIDGVVVKVYDLSSYSIDGVPFRPFIRLYQHKDADATLSFALAESVEHCEFAYDALNDITGCSLTHPSSYVIGQVVTLKVTPKGTLRCQELSLDGQPITPDASGNYSFVATKNGHALVAKYVSHFGSHAEWDLSGQDNGVLSIAAPDGDTGWLATSANTYTHMGIHFNAAGAGKEKEGLQLSFRLDFTNGKVLTFRFINDQNNGAGYRLQAMTNGANMIGNWSGIYSLNEAQTQKLLGEGIQFDLRIDGNNVHFIIDGVTVKTYDLSSHGVAGTTFKVNYRLYQHKENPFTMTYVLD